MISLRTHALKAMAAATVILLAAGCDKDLNDDKPDFSSNLVHYFPFSGNSVDEVTKQEYDMHGVTFLSDRNDTEASSAFFNGFSGWMDISAGLKEPEGTVSFWIFPCLCKENNPIYVKKSLETDPLYGQYYIGFSEAGEMQTSCRGKWDTKSEPLIQPNRWYHIVIRWDDASGVVDIFVNGKKKHSAQYTVDPSNLPDDIAPTYMGKLDEKVEGKPSTVEFYKGKFDDARYYNKWLPWEAIDDLYTE